MFYFPYSVTCRNQNLQNYQNRSELLKLKNCQNLSGFENYQNEDATYSIYFPVFCQFFNFENSQILIILLPIVVLPTNLPSPFLKIILLPMFGISFRYVKVRTCPSIDGRKAPAFHTFHNCLFSDMQAKGLLLALTKRDASLNSEIVYLCNNDSNKYELTRI